MFPKTEMEICCYRYRNFAFWLGLRFRKVTTIVDIDEKNLTYARSNIIQNNLKSRIRPYQTKLNDPLIPLDAIGLERHVSEFELSNFRRLTPLSASTSVCATLRSILPQRISSYQQPPSPGHLIQHVQAQTSKWSRLAERSRLSAA